MAQSCPIFKVFTGPNKIPSVYFINKGLGIKKKLINLKIRDQIGT